jgi:hypothetical protein
VPLDSARGVVVERHVKKQKSQNDRRLTLPALQAPVPELPGSFINREPDLRAARANKRERVRSSTAIDVCK